MPRLLFVKVHKLPYWLHTLKQTMNKIYHLTDRGVLIKGFIGKNKKLRGIRNIHINVVHKIKEKIV